MYNDLIGFRLKFDNVLPEELKEMITNYLKLFNRFEIKVTHNLLSSGKIDNLIKICEQYAKTKYSIHLPKNMLKRVADYEDAIGLISVLNKYWVSNVNVITHIPVTNYNEYISKIIKFSQLLDNKNVFLLENKVIFYNNFEYLKQINDLFNCLNKMGIRHIGMCLDIAHLLFGAYKESLSQKEIFDILKQYPILLKSVKQIHLHDYNTLSDHLLLGEGMIDIDELKKFINENIDNVPVIIETTINNPKSDGIHQIHIAKSIINKVV